MECMDADRAHENETRNAGVNRALNIFGKTKQKSFTHRSTLLSALDEGERGFDWEPPPSVAKPPLL